MQESLEASLVRIHTADGRVVGAGFLVGERHILTCAHVVSQALDLGQAPLDAPQGAVSLDFPLLPPRTLCSARVVLWCPPLPDGRGDIAGLELQGGPPAGAEMVRFAPAEDVWEHPFRTFGFPSGYDDGVWATGRLLGRQATDWVMIEDIKAQGFAVGPGFSGTPVWDTQLQGVVGMVVAASRLTDLKAAFVLPLDVLVAAWPLIEPLTRQRVFLSAAPANADLAARLTTDLEARDIVVWTEQHTPGEEHSDKEERIRQAIRAAQAVVLVVSNQTRSSRTVKEHLRLADLYQRRLILVWVGDGKHAQPQYYGWRETVWVDAHSTQYAAALDAIEANLSQRRSISDLLGLSQAGPEQEPRNPYKGLRAFTADDAGDFFGRDRLVDELIKGIGEMQATGQAKSENGRLLTIIGPSGSGKSSVVMAGLLPKLRHGALPGSKAWVYLEPMVPGKHPIETLSLTLKPHFPDTSFKTLQEDMEDDATRGLHLLATQLVKRQESTVVLMVDQFEELFTQTESEEERRRFIDLLLTATTELRGPLLVLLTLRADFYDRLLQYPELYHLVKTYQQPMLPMEIDDLRATIEQPAALPDVQITFEGNLIGDLLFEMQSQVGVLPLLQFTLEQLFQRRSGHHLTLQAYHEIGGVKGALAQHAEKTYKDLLSDEHRRLARALFLRLIEPGATEQDTTRRRAALTEFEFDNAKQTHVMSETIDAFVAARLLMTNDIAGVKTLEVSHEAVIREWPRLAGWLKEARADIPLQQAVSDDTEEWVRHGKPKDRLYRGTQLKEANTWATRYMVSERELAFLRASERQHQRSFLLKVTVMFLILILVIPIGLLGVPKLLSLAQQNNLLPITVTSLNDDGPGSLREAMQAASPKNHTIYFDAGLKGKTIMLTDNLILEKSLTLIGSGVTISSGDHDYQISVNSGYSVTMEDLAFKQGMLKGNHFIHNYGTLILDHTSFSDISKKAPRINLIYNDRGQLIISNSMISDNNITGEHTALIYNNGGQLTITNSTITNNIGEIYNTGGPMTITNSIISNMNRNNPNKTRDGSPSAIYNDTDGSLTIRDSAIADNISYFNGGSIFNGGTLTISGSTISGNSFLSILGTDDTKNGGGIANDMGATLTISNSTIAGNTAGNSGGGIANWGNMLMSFCTVYGNSARAGGGIAVLAGFVTLSNSILAGNTLVAGEQPFHPHIIGTLISQGYNLIQNMTKIVQRPASTPDTSNIAVARFTPVHDRTVSAGDLTKIFDPQGLQNNGVPTKTYKLLPGPDDPAIDAIPLAACDIPDIFDKATRKYIDQRGMKRPDGNERFCDIGAYEYVD